MKRPPASIVYGAAIAAITAYLLLDTFVIAKAYQTGITTEGITEAFAAAEKRLNSSASSTTDEEDTDHSQTQTSTDDGVNSTLGDSNSSSTGDATATESAEGKANSSGTTSTDGSTRHSRGQNGSTRAHGSSSTKGGRTNSSSSTAHATDATVSSVNSLYNDYDENGVHISVKEYTVSGSKVYVADVRVDSAAHLLSAFAQGTYGKNVTATTSSIASDVGAVLAINGDFYGTQEAGYVIRNGKVYRSTIKEDSELCCIYADGSMRIIDPADATADELVASGVWQAFCFGPALVRNDTVVVTAGTEVGHAMASNPRTAIGVFDTNHYAFVVSDGRSNESVGLSLTQLANFMHDLGVSCAYNLDGGGSSTMYYQGRLVNHPITNGTSIQERSVSDIVYVK